MLMAFTMSVRYGNWMLLLDDDSRIHGYGIYIRIGYNTGQILFRFFGFHSLCQRLLFPGGR